MKKLLKFTLAASFLVFSLMPLLSQEDPPAVCTASTICHDEEIKTCSGNLICYADPQRYVQCDDQNKKRCNIAHEQ